MAGDEARVDALERRFADLEHRLELQTARFRSFQEVALALGSILDLDQLLEVIMTEVTRLMDAERSTLFLCDDARREIWSKVAQGTEVREIRVRYGEGIAGHVAVTGEPVNIPDAYRDAHFQQEWDRRTGFRTRSVLCQPIRNNRGKITGVIQVLNKKSGAFDANDEALLAALASQASVPIENSKLYQSVVTKNEELLATQRQLERKMFELEFLFQVQQELSCSSVREPDLESVIARVLEVLGCEAGSIVLSSERGDDLLFRWAVGPRSESIKRFRLPAGVGIAGWVAREGQPVLANDPAHDPRHRWPIAEALSFAAQSILCVPLLIDDRAAGAFELINKRAGDFTQDDLKLLTLTAGLVAGAIQQSRHREAQERASRLADLGQMLSGILHDLKTPMTIISGFAQLMAQDRPLEERQQCSEAILRQLDHLSAMTREVLAFARGESTILVRKVYVHKFAEEIAELLARDFASRNIDFRMDLRYRGIARFDEGKMRRAIYNIARNAMEAMSGGGSFTITIEQEDGWLVFTFADTGPGIPEEIQDRLFDSFVTQGKANGTGLGLAIVKKIVDDHQGKITFETARGKGTTFRCRIPLPAEN